MDKLKKYLTERIAAENEQLEDFESDLREFNRRIKEKYKLGKDEIIYIDYLSREEEREYYAIDDWIKRSKDILYELQQIERIITPKEW